MIDAESVPIAAAGDILRYLPWLLWEIAKSNVVVVRAILTNRCEPCWVETPASQRTELGLATYANSITLTPGTVTVDANGPMMEVHALTQEAADDLESGEMDRRVTQMERRLVVESEKKEGEG